MQERVAEVPKTEKYKGGSQPDFKAVHVITVDRELKPEQKIVEE